MGLAVEDVSKTWRGDAGSVLQGVCLHVEPRSAVHITGRNGAGKTTLLRIAAGVIAPDSGTVRLGGLCGERSRREFQRQVGFLSAASNTLYARLSVRRHLDLWARLCLLPRARRGPAVLGGLAAFGLTGLSDRRADRLSMGQRQRLRMAMAFLHDPQLVLLDEPCNSLDAEGTELLESAVRRLLARGGLAVAVGPSAEQAPTVFGVHHVLERGRLRAA